MPTDYSCQVLTAGFSFHRKPYIGLHPEGVKNYLMRLQTDGRCRARVDGEMSLVDAGDLLLFSPDEPYELRIDKEQNQWVNDLWKVVTIIFSSTGTG